LLTSAATAHPIARQLKNPQEDSPWRSRGYVGQAGGRARRRAACAARCLRARWDGEVGQGCAWPERHGRL